MYASVWCVGHILDTHNNTSVLFQDCTQSVEVSLLVSVELLEVDIGPLGVLLLQVFVERILMAEDEVQLVVLTTLVWSKHDGVGCAILELLLWCRVNGVSLFSLKADKVYPVPPHILKTAEEYSGGFGFCVHNTNKVIDCTVTYL